MALEAIINREGIYRIVLEEYTEGVYVLVYDSPQAPRGPCKDHLQDDWEMAKIAALEDYGITEDQWKEAPDTRFRG
ncbi:MAG: hypothetical protein KF912_13530 [Phycisphaeraceae bacterium]|nr:hypothetical protein [Phycisphaeraceae bacterium]MBX3368328.1 hypothetical protein [Phycisphaeraceae bacterium]QYK48886.1 MAG: hypothetical protein KF838_03325 [Phycisphaeraceae bacterium]